jgi:hypothetical protein
VMPTGDPGVQVVAQEKLEHEVAPQAGRIAEKLAMSASATARPGPNRRHEQRRDRMPITPFQNVSLAH